jgi:hypothetical protein
MVDADGRALSVAINRVLRIGVSVELKEILLHIDAGGGSLPPDNAT